MRIAWTWAQVFAVAIGATIGALARWLAGLWLNAQWAGFPLGTLFVNCVGGLLIGIALAWFERSPNELLRLLLERGQFAMTLLHTAAHVLGALACAALGHAALNALLD